MLYFTSICYNFIKYFLPSGDCIFSFYFISYLEQIFIQLQVIGVCCVLRVWPLWPGLCQWTHSLPRPREFPLRSPRISRVKISPSAHPSRQISERNNDTPGQNGGNKNFGEGWRGEGAICGWERRT